MKTKAAKTIVGLKDLRENMEKYIRQVEAGQTLTIVRRSSPVFRLAPIADDESLWEEVIDFTKVKKGGVSIDEVLARL
jgi:prevent-host-death family protein